MFLIASMWTLDFAGIVLMVAVGLGMVIFVHELGHFVVAKLCGVKCLKFYIGFDIGGWKFCKFRWGETEYGIGILPLGGYVKMLGQEDNPARLKEELQRAKAQQSAPDTPPSEKPDTAASESGATAGLSSSARLDEPTVAPADIEAMEKALFDPRSFLAQSVPRRMAIFSAGVIMNIVFAFVMAVIAYQMGVKQTPCVVGSLQPGDPAWQNNMKVGDRILAVGDEKVFRFRDLQASVSLGDAEGGLPMRIQRPGVAEDLSITIMPNRTRLFPTIGISNPLTTSLVKSKKVKPYLYGSPVALARPPFQGGDTIVAIDDVPIETYARLHAELAHRRDKSIRVTVSRAVEPKTVGGEEQDETVSIEVAARPMRRLGLVMAMGPITAVQVDSPAAEAKLQPGDRIVKIDDQAPGDPMTLPDRLRRRADKGDKNVTLAVDRDGKQIETVVALRKSDAFETPMHEDSPVTANALGIAYEVLPTVAAVIKETPAARANIRPGDVIAKATLVPPDAKTLREHGLDQEAIDAVEEITLDFDGEKSNWPLFFYAVQLALPDSRVELELTDEREVSLEWYEATDWFNPERGFRFKPPFLTQKAESFGEALSLGGAETLEMSTRVVRFLYKLITGDISPKALGGPWMIAKAAGASAARGTPELLLFLTLLSANLAVLNFLPIPILDGGHMVFLAWEAVRGKPADERVQLALSYMGLFLLLGLMAWVISLDFGWIPRN
jgi:regulator of sigma E protease